MEMLAFAILFVCPLLGSCQQLLLAPINKVALVGETVEFRWETVDSLDYWRWALSQPNRTPENIVNNNLRFGKNFSHFQYNDSRSSMIYTDSVKLEDGGIYKFNFRFVNESIINVFAVQLTVLESLPQCEYRNKDEDIVELSCRVNFRGFWAPKMNWEIIGDREENRNLRPTNETIFNANVTSSIEVNISNRPKDLMIRCTTFFNKEAGDEIETNATSIPDFIYHWNWSYVDSGVLNSVTENDRPKALEIGPTIVLVVASVVMLGIGLVIGFIIHRTMQRNKQQELETASIDATLSGTMRSNNGRSPTLKSPDNQSSSTSYPIYYELEPPNSQGDTELDLREIETGTVPVYEEIGRQYSTISSKCHCDDSDIQHCNEEAKSSTRFQISAPTPPDLKPSPTSTMNKKDPLHRTHPAQLTDGGGHHTCTDTPLMVENELYRSGVVLRLPELNPDDLNFDPLKTLTDLQRTRSTQANDGSSSQFADNEFNSYEN